VTVKFNCSVGQITIERWVEAIYMKKGAIPILLIIAVLTILFYLRVIDPLEFLRAILIALVVVSSGLLLKAIEKWGNNGQG
jgi:hypothetical protein